MRSVLILFVVCGVVSGQSNTCQDQDDNSLFQRPALLGLQPTRMNATELLKSVRSVADSLRTNSVASMIPEAVIAALGTAVTALHAMMPMFAEQHAGAQQEMEHAVEVVEACHSQDEGEVRAHFVQAVATKLAAKEQCEESLSHAIETEHDACEGQGELPNHLCNVARTAVSHKIALCDAVTATYEVTFCTLHLSCGMIHDCHAQEMEVYKDLRADVEAAMVARQQQYHTVMQAQCLMNLITIAKTTTTPIDDASLAACGDVSSDDLTIAFPEPPPAPAECPELQSSDPQCDPPEPTFA